MFVNFSPASQFGHVTTQAPERRNGRPIGSTEALGEEGGGGGPIFTTLALGEEGGGIRAPIVTTKALGEEGGGDSIMTTIAHQVLDKADALGNKDGAASKEELGRYVTEAEKELAHLEKQFQDYKDGKIQFFADPQFERRIAELNDKIKAAKLLNKNADVIADEDGVKGTISHKDVDVVAGLDGKNSDISKVDVEKASKQPPVPPVPPQPPIQQIFALMLQLLQLLLKMLGQGDGSRHLPKVADDTGFLSD